MLWLLPSSVYPKSRTLSCLMLCHWGGTQIKAGRELCWDRWLKVAKGVFHTTEHHAHFMNWGSYLEEEASRSAGMESGIGQQLYCASLGFPWVLFFPFNIIIHYYYISPVFQLLNCSYLNLQILHLILLPIPPDSRVWASSSVALNCQLDLNHTSALQVWVISVAGYCSSYML